MPGQWGRNIDWDNGLQRTNHARAAAPYNSSSGNAYPDPLTTATGSGEKECYYGGEWYVPKSVDSNSVDYYITSISEDDYVNDVSDLTYDDVTVSYPVTVSFYTFNFDTYHFPDSYGGTGSNSAYLDTLFSFSAGYFEVLIPFPETTDADTTALTLVASVTDTTLTSEGDTDSSAQTADDYDTSSDEDDDKAVEIDTEVNPLKYVSFMYRDGNAHESSGYEYNYPVDTDGNYINIDYGSSSNEKFLGDTWGTNKKDHNASSIVGSTVDLWGATMAQQGSDYNLTAIDILQVFDSTAFEIVNDDSDFVEPGYAAVKTVYADTEDVFGETGTITFLYAADTKYPDGYNSNYSTHLERMKELREDTEQLVYYTSLEALENDDYTCIGVLMEVRGAYISRGNYVGMRIPLKIKSTEAVNSSGETGSDSTVNNVYCSVNQLMTWSYVSGFDQEYQPMYGISRYIQATDGSTTASGVFNNSSDTYDDGGWNQTLSSSTTGTASYTYTETTYDEEADEETETEVTVSKPYYCDGEYTLTLTDNGDNDKTYLPTKYVSSYTDDLAGTIGEKSSDSYYHSKKKNYNSSNTPYRYGMSLLITGYEASIEIAASKSSWSKSTAEEPKFTISGIVAGNTLLDDDDTSTTSFKITVDIGNDNLSYLDSDGNLVDNIYIGGITAVSTDENNPTEYTFGDYTLSVYAVVEDDKLVIYISGAPLNTELPEITFSTRITDDASSGSSATLTASISGESDLRFYNTSYLVSVSNQDSDSVSITALSSDGYNKYVGSSGSASSTTIEVNDTELIYRISYKSDLAITCLNIFDVIPYNDISSGGTTDIATYIAKLTGGGERPTLTSIEATSTTSSGDSYSPPVMLYATTYDPTDTGSALYSAVNTCTSDATTSISALGNAFGIPDPTASSSLGTVETDKARGLLAVTSGEYTVDSSVTLYEYGYSDTADSSGVYNAGTPTKYSVSDSNSITAVFATIGYDSNYEEYNDTHALKLYSENISSFDSTSSENTAVTANGTIVLELTFELPGENDSVNIADNLTGGDLFVNRGYIKLNTLGITSTNFNATSYARYGVITRSISGKVFLDYNKDDGYSTDDGSKDSLLSGVTVALFKANDSGTYTQITTNLLGNTLMTETDSDGTYSFEYLEEGSYLIAFIVSDYQAAALRNYSDTANDNDAVAVADVTDSTIAGILSAYDYVIQADDDTTYLTLETSYSNLKVAETNYDLGVQSGYTLPEAGGNGTAPYRNIGLALLAIGAALIFCKKRRQSL